MTWKVPGFEPIVVIGRGRTGVVMSARDSATGSTVAVKYLSDAAHRALDSVDRFRDDVVELERIEHPNVAQVYQFVEAPAGAVIITQLVDGVTLRRLIDAGGPLDPEAALYVLKSALLGLGEVHGRGIVHRDVKPENLIIDAHGVTKVVDIGIAVRSGPGAAPGDPRYQAPELQAGDAPTPASDVYAATAVLFECLTGRPLREAAGGFLRPRQHDMMLTPQFLNVPSQVRAFCRLGLTRSPDGRPADADRLCEQLDLVAHSAYGPDWEEAGRAKLASRLEGDLTVPRRAAAVRILANVAGRPAVMVAIGLVVLLGGGALIAATGALTPADAARTLPGSTHIPVVLVGPTVPVATSSAPVAVKPQQPTGLHVTGRSQTAVSLDWNPAHDNAPVAGFIVARDAHRVGTTYVPGFTDTGLTPKTRYGFTVTAFDAAGNLSPSSAAVFETTLTEPDTSPPSVPAGLHVTGRSTTTIVLAWSAAHDNIGVAGYDVFRDGTLIKSVTKPSVTDTGLAAATTHSYAVRSFDTANNASARSQAVAATTLAAPDTTPPTAPTGVAATGTSVSSVGVTWNASTDNVGVTGYRVFRDGSQIATTAGTSYADDGLLASTTYTYTVRAVDAASNQSAPSSPSSATTQAPPTPTPTPTPTTPPPTPVVTQLLISASPITSPGCTTTVEATVVVSGGPITVDLQYNLPGSSGVQSVSFADSGQQTVVLGVADGTLDGSASVNDPVSSLSASTNWTVPIDCVPAPPTTDPPTPDPTT